MSRLPYVLMMMWLAGLALGLPAGMVTHGAKAGAKGVNAIDANHNGINEQIAKNGTVAAKVRAPTGKPDPSDVSQHSSRVRAANAVTTAISHRARIAHAPLGALYRRTYVSHASRRRARACRRCVSRGMR